MYNTWVNDRNITNERTKLVTEWPKIYVNNQELWSSAAKEPKQGIKQMKKVFQVDNNVIIKS